MAIIRSYVIYGETYEYTISFQYREDFDIHLERLLSAVIENSSEEYLWHGFYNLIQNAIKYSKAGRVNIDLVFSANQPGITCSIKDEGIGIEPEYLDDIFLEFVRSPNVHDHGYEGSGLGLPIVKEVFDEHDAKISVESIINKGTVFRVAFNEKSTPIRI